MSERVLVEPRECDWMKRDRGGNRDLVWDKPRVQILSLHFKIHSAAARSRSLKKLFGFQDEISNLNEIDLNVIILYTFKRRRASFFDLTKWRM